MSPARSAGGSSPQRRCHTGRIEPTTLPAASSLLDMLTSTCFNLRAMQVHAQRQLARRALQTILNGVLVRTFKGWADAAREAVEERREAEERGEAQARLDEERLRMARNRMAHRLESIVFESWHTLAVESKALRAKGFARWRHAAAAKGFYKWAEFAEEHARMVRLGRQASAQIRRRVSS